MHILFDGNDVVTVIAIPLPQHLTLGTYMYSHQIHGSTWSRVVHNRYRARPLHEYVKVNLEDVPAVYRAKVLLLNP